MRTWSFSCVRIGYTRGLGTLTASQHNIFWFGKKPSHNFFLCSSRGSNLGSLDLDSDALPIEPLTPSPHASLWLCNARVVFRLIEVLRKWKWWSLVPWGLWKCYKKKESKTEMIADVQENQSKHTCVFWYMVVLSNWNWWSLVYSHNPNTQEVTHERFLISTRQNNVRFFGISCL